LFVCWNKINRNYEKIFFPHDWNVYRKFYLLFPFLKFIFIFSFLNALLFSSEVIRLFKFFYSNWSKFNSYSNMFKFSSKYTRVWRCRYLSTFLDFWSNCESKISSKWVWPLDFFKNSNFGFNLLWLSVFRAILFVI
jgi:hypothetical protein